LVVPYAYIIIDGLTISLLIYLCLLQKHYTAPLVRACEKGLFKVVTALIEKGADLDLKDGVSFIFILNFFGWLCLCHDVLPLTLPLFAPPLFFSFPLYMCASSTELQNTHGCTSMLILYIFFFLAEAICLLLAYSDVRFAC
jgi:hypothetical protein